MTTERGFIALARGALNHPVVGASKPFSKFEAWAWLLFEAAYKPRRYNAGGTVCQLERGQLAHSTRYMAQAWGWPETTVRRFLTRLKTGAGTGAMIGAESGAGITVVSICNYERYQSRQIESGAPNGAANGAPNGAKVAHERRRKEQGNKVTIESKTSAPRLEVSSGQKGWPPDAFEQWWKIVPKRIDRLEAERRFSRLAKDGSVAFADIMTATRRWSSAMQGTEPKYIKAPAVWLNKGGYLDESKSAIAEAATCAAPKRSRIECSEAEWGIRLRLYKNGQPWPVEHWGPMPGQPGCVVPPGLLIGVASSDHTSRVAVAQ